MAVGLVTGASAGLGLQLATLLAKDGHDVVLVARGQERLEALAERLRAEHGVTAWVVPADLSEPGAAQRVFDAVRAEGVQVEFLVNNAGFGSNGPFVEQDIAREVDMVQVNVAALVHLTGLFLPGMLERGSGRVLNIASTAGFQPGPLMATYYATKAFVLSFTEAIAEETKGSGVTVTCHCPGPTATEFGEISGNADTKLFKSGRVAPADEVAAHAYRAMMRGKILSIHGLINWFGAFTVRLAPRSFVRALVAQVNTKV